MKQEAAPFKFLDAYQQEDNDVFFGRAEETRNLYDALSGVKHLLVYGPSGAGKTSLIECGLRNQFSDADWFALSIRRRNDINQEVFRSINQALGIKMELHPDSGLPLDPQLGFSQAIEQLFDERFQPIYLLFDQFEELLLLGNQSEKEDFFRGLHELIRFRVPCRVMLIMREEFIGHLSEFEPLCPSLFKHRFRLEKMGRSQVRQVIQQILTAPVYATHFSVEENEELADHILSRLPDQKKEIELTHVQVFLSEIWDRAFAAKGSQALPVLRKNLVREADNLEGVLDAFLKKQLLELTATHGQKAPLELLACMISERYTKLQVTGEEIRRELAANQVAPQQPLPSLIAELERRRIIRSLRSGDTTRYEITHDLLAFVIGQNLTEEIQLREKAGGIYKVYAERKGYFTQEDLDYLRPYQQYKPYPPDLAARVRESEAFLRAEQDRSLEAARAQAQKEQSLRTAAEKNAKRARERTAIATIVAVLALIAALAALYFFVSAQNAADLAEVRRQDAEMQKQKAEKEEQRAQDALQEADSLRLEAEKALESLKKQQFQTSLAQAGEFREKKQFQEALAAYENARSLLDSTDTKQQNMMERNLRELITEKRKYDFLTAREQGLSLARIDECKAALTYLELARRLTADPDSELENALEKCKNQ